jgi:hypothetical protein
MQTRTWLDDEATLADGARQAMLLFLRGMRRPLVTLGISLLLSGGLAAALILPKHAYTPKLLLRVIEADQDPTSMPQPKRKLREYVQQALLTSDRLTPLIQRYGLYPSLARKNMRAALDSFREDIDVDVYQNYFVEQRALGSAPRSARVAVSYRGRDADTAVAVTRDLGSLIVERERAMRSAESDRAEGDAERELTAVRAAISDKTMEIMKMQTSLQDATKPDPTRQVQIVGLLGTLDALERRENEMSQREAALSLGAAMERHGIGLSFEIADDAELPNSTRRRDITLFSVGASLVFGLPLVAMAVGTLGSKRGKA